MHPRVNQLPFPRPDYGRFLRAIERKRPSRVPLIELGIHPRVVAVLLNEPHLANATSQADILAVIAATVRLQHRLGFDVVKAAARIPWIVPRLHTNTADAPAALDRNWADESEGPIRNSQDFERFQWPRPADVDYRPLDSTRANLPDGMRIIGFAGGVLEFSMDLMGMERFMLATITDPQLVTAIVERVGATIERVFETYCQMESVCALWLGDDLGYKTGPLLSPKFLEQHIFPWYRRFADLAHRNNRPFLLHSCGDTRLLMPTLVDKIGIDAKHSFEDGILRVEDFYDQWREKAAVLGGVDVDLLARGSADDIRRRTLAILEHTDAGGYACGSGNSIPDYVPPESFLTMIEAVAEFNAAR